MLSLEPQRTALLVMDLQTDVLPRFGDKAAPLLARTAELIASARRASVPVIYIVVGFRPGYPEVSPNNQTFAPIAQSGRFIGTAAADVAAQVRPIDGDVVVVKHRVGAFAGTDLDMVLRAQGRDALVLGGVATSGVVLSTVRAGSDADYRLVVAKDACADLDDEVHHVLMDKVFPRQASVVSSAEVVAALTPH
jgi:nicotinamidase-related amidase